MSQKRHWPESHTYKLLDYIDRYGTKFVTKGRQRQEGYDSLRKYLNAKCTPRPRPQYTVNDINKHCQYICSNFACVFGPNLKSFFSNGRKYLLSPLVLVPEVNDSEADDLRMSNSITSPTIEPSTYHYSKSPSRLLRPRSCDLPRSQPSPTIRKKQKLLAINKTNIEERGYLEMVAAPSEWQELFNLRSKKDRVPFQHIKKGMVRLDRLTSKVVDAYFPTDVSEEKLPKPDFNFIENNEAELFDLLRKATSIEQLDVSERAKIKSKNLLKAIIGWVLFDWVLQDPFPTFGTECGVVWEELKEVLNERGE